MLAPKKRRQSREAREQKEEEKNLRRSRVLLAQAGADSAPPLSALSPGTNMYQESVLELKHQDTAEHSTRQQYQTGNSTACNVSTRRGEGKAGTKEFIAVA